MSSDHWVVKELILVYLLTFLKHKQVLLLCSLCYRLHGLSLSVLELERNTGIDQVEGVNWLFVHDFGEKHEFERFSS